MSEIPNIANAFPTKSETIEEFFQTPGMAFYIPLYQRAYSWDRENIDQLMDDISQGVDNLRANSGDIRFLGTVIKVRLHTPENSLYPKSDPKALPTRVDKIIDGQQRIATIALLGTLLHHRFETIRMSLSSHDELEDLREAINEKQVILLELFSKKIRGKPKLKPIIIRGAIDRWTFDGKEDDYYKSDVSRYLAHAIKVIDENSSELPEFPGQSLVGRNLLRMSEYLDAVEGMPEKGRDALASYPEAVSILESMGQREIWAYEMPALREILGSDANDEAKAILERYVRLAGFAHYLLRRCCITAIDPTVEDWAFDMFQSLNATGTPLTALETFKPTVVRSVGEEGAYEKSKSKQYFDLVDELMPDKGGSAQKIRVTNEYMSTLALSTNGEKLPRRFSSQRRWLEQHYSEFSDDQSKEVFIMRMADMAVYYRMIHEYDFDSYPWLPRLNKLAVEDRDLATLCVLFLHDANHTMAHSILAQFYSRVIHNVKGSQQEFLRAAKAIAAFYALWRAAYSNSGLDQVYRLLLKGDQDRGIPSVSWFAANNSFTSKTVSSYFTAVLESEGRRIGIRQEWLDRAVQNLRYDRAKPITHFCLLVAFHDTIPDSNAPGLMKEGAKGSAGVSYLSPWAWRGSSFKTIEHIAPQTRSSDSKWPKAIYREDDHQKIGNLTLLPGRVNTSVGNRDWSGKWLYYSHLAEKDPDKLEELLEKAKSRGVVFHDNSIEILENASYKHHVEPLTTIGITGTWTRAIIRQRTERICTIVWDRIYPWLQS